jgi:hypothetical protein
MKQTKELLGFSWSQASRWQKWGMRIAGVVLVVIAVGGYADSCWSNYQRRKADNLAAKARLEAGEALEKAKKIADEARKIEGQIAQLEVERDEAKTKLAVATGNRADAERAYERARTEPIGRIPSTAELCADLAALGRPCAERPE